jgi:hypothetical protein
LGSTRELYPDRGIRGYWGFSSAAVAASFNQGVEADAKLLGAISVAVFRAPLTPNVIIHRHPSAFRVKESE